MKTNFQLDIRQNLYTIFHYTTEQMSQQEKAVRGTIVCLLPEMVSSLRKDIYFFAPDVSYFLNSVRHTFNLQFSVNVKLLFLGSYREEQIRRIDASTQF